MYFGEESINKSTKNTKADIADFDLKFFAPDIYPNHLFLSISIFCTCIFADGTFIQKSLWALGGS